METELAAVSEYLKKIEDEALPSPSRCEGCLREANRMGLVGENSGLWGEKKVCVSHCHVSVSLKLQAILGKNALLELKGRHCCLHRAFRCRCSRGVMFAQTKWFHANQERGGRPCSSVTTT